VTTGMQLLFAILADPTDDTVRLAYADWLEENGHAGRAEFIRVQIELSGRVGRHPISLLAREASLLAANPSWSQVRCPDFEGSDGALCAFCRGAGDLLRVARWRRGHRGRTKSSSRNPVFIRGFLDSVACQWGELGDGLFPVAGQVFSPSPWARALVKAMPTLTRLVVMDMEPGVYGTRPGEYYWTRLNTEVIPSDFNRVRHLLPPVLWDRLDGFLGNPLVRPGEGRATLYINTGTYESPVWSETTLLPDLRFTRRYPTRDAAHDALARAARAAVTEGLKEGSIRPHFAPD